MQSGWILLRLRQMLRVPSEEERLITTMLEEVVSPENVTSYYSHHSLLQDIDSWKPGQLNSTFIGRQEIAKQRWPWNCAALTTSLLPS